MTVNDALQFGIGQTAQLEKANGRTKDVIQLVDRCDALVEDMAKKLKPKPFWKFWD